MRRATSPQPAPPLPGGEGEPNLRKPNIFRRLARVPKLTRLRLALALAVAVATDGVQMLFGTVAWLPVEPLTDLAAMLLTCWLLGFHWLLLPTFAIKLVPLADELPTWTACVAAVIAIRKREQRLHS